jgi:hypothetical protein
MDSLRDRILAIKEEHDTTKRFQLLPDLNNSLPTGWQLKFPTLVTNAYIRRALDIIEARIEATSSTLS